MTNSSVTEAISKAVFLLLLAALFFAFNLCAFSLISIHSFFIFLHLCILFPPFITGLANLISLALSHSLYLLFFLYIIFSHISWSLFSLLFQLMHNSDFLFRISCLSLSLGRPMSCSLFRNSSLFLSVCSPSLPQPERLQTRLCPLYPPVPVVMMLSLIITHRCALYLAVGMVVVVLVRKVVRSWQCCPGGLDLLMIGHLHRASPQLPAPNTQL